MTTKYTERLLRMRRTALNLAIALKVGDVDFARTLLNTLSSDLNYVEAAQRRVRGKANPTTPSPEPKPKPEPKPEHPYVLGSWADTGDSDGDAE